MAGDWIKMRGNLWDDPRIGRLADITDAGEATVIGGLYWLWASADQHTEDGVMPGLSTRRIDTKTGIKGLGEALVEIGWLEIHPDGLRIVNFQDHNGASAKKRCQTAKRVASFKAGNAQNTEQVDEGNADSVSEALLQRDLEKRREEEEKRREEEAVSGKSVGGAGAPAAKPGKGSRMAADWRLPKAWGDWALDEYEHWTPDVVRLEAAKFKDYWKAKPGKDGSKSDWEATWRNWCRSPIAQGAHSPQRALKPSQMTEAERSDWEQSESEKAKQLLFGDVVEMETPILDGIDYDEK